MCVCVGGGGGGNDGDWAEATVYRGWAEGPSMKV